MRFDQAQFMRMMCMLADWLAAVIIVNDSVNVIAATRTIEKASMAR